MRREMVTGRVGDFTDGRTALRYDPRTSSPHLNLTGRGILLHRGLIPTPDLESSLTHPHPIPSLVSENPLQD